MDATSPETVSVRIKHLRILIDNNAALAQNDYYELEGVFVHRDLVLNQVAALDAVVKDSIQLNARSRGSPSRNFALLQPSFLDEQDENIYNVIEDLDQLRKAKEGGSRNLRLQMMSEAFVMRLIQDTCNPAVENIDMCAKAEVEVDVHTLNVMKPDFVKKLMRWFLKVAESHVAQNKDAASYINFRDSAEGTMASLREEVASLRAAEAEMRSKAEKLEAVVDSLKQDKSNLEELLKTSHVALSNLGEEKRRLEESSKVSTTAARAAVEAIQGEVNILRAINADCDRRISEQTVQLARYQEQLDARDNELAALKTATAAAAPREPRRGGVLRLRYTPHVKPVPPSRGSWEGNLARSSPAGSSRASRSEGVSGVTAYASSDEADEEDKDEDEQGEGEEAEKSESKDEEDEEEHQVDQEMKDATDAIEAELQDTKEKLQAALQKAARLEVELVLCRDNPTMAEGTSSSPAVDRIPPSLTSVNLAALALLALPHRARELAKLPEMKVDLPPKLSGMYNAFTRASIKESLGGSVGGFLVRCTNSQTDRAKEKEISSFLCLNMNMNPWLPAAPGRHGYMQVGFDQDLKLLLDGQSQHVFVGAGRWFFYCGEYRIRRMDDLTLGEWNMLPLPRMLNSHQPKKLLSSMANNLSIHDVLQRYEAGELRLPCVQLECIGFEMEFYKAIIDDNRQHAHYGGTPVPTVSSAKSVTSGKRRRVH